MRLGFFRNDSPGKSYRKKKKATQNQGIWAGIALLVYSNFCFAWQYHKQGDVIFATEVMGAWGASFSGNKHAAEFCFIGPFRVEQGQRYTVWLKAGAGKWFDAPFDAYDHETLCTYEGEKARGLLGIIFIHDTLGFGLTINGQFEHVIFRAGELSNFPNAGWK